jgi:uncharacterized protein YvpB
MVVAQKILVPQHPYHAVLQKNLRFAREALLKSSQKRCRQMQGYDRKTRRIRAGQKNSLLSVKGAQRQPARSRRWFAGGLLVVSFLMAGFFSGWTVLNKGLVDASTLNSGVPGNEPVFFNQDVKENLARRYVLQEEMLLEVPLILQNPELPRGCEVTSLAMLLQYAGVSVDKMTLAREIKKDSTPYQIKSGKIYFGNPYNGFVGNMYTLREPGYGVYHGPVRELLEKYLPGRTIDLTGCSFEEILLFVSEEVPVWVVANATFAPLASGEFQTWHTPQGPVEITYREHAVLLTGYDAEYVYINDPRSNIKNKQASRQKFVAAWKQMGGQAVTYLPY